MTSCYGHGSFSQSEVICNDRNLRHQPSPPYCRRWAKIIIYPERYLLQLILLSLVLTIRRKCNVPRIMTVSAFKNPLQQHQLFVNRISDNALRNNYVSHGTESIHYHFLAKTRKQEVTVTNMFWTPTTTTRASRVNSSNNQYWEGDDLRWLSKMRRRRFTLFNDWRGQPMRNSIILCNIVLFSVQIFNTIAAIRHMYPKSWSSYYLTIIFDTIMGNSRPGPFTLQFVSTSNRIMSMEQSYRYITSGFLHGSVVHLFLNMNAMRQLPSWLETGLGSSLYVTTYLLSIIGGNIAHTLSTLDSGGSNVLCLGASGGICGLYGLMYISLVRMKNNSAAWQVIKGMGFLFLWGILITNVSNAAHFGGFVTGIVISLLCGPSYRSSYGLRRKNSLEVDPYNRDYRTVMGFDKVPTTRNAVLPLPALWLLLVCAYAIQLRYHAAPKRFLQGFFG